MFNIILLKIILLYNFNNTGACARRHNLLQRYIKTAAVISLTEGGRKVQLRPKGSWDPNKHNMDNYPTYCVMKAKYFKLEIYNSFRFNTI